MIGLNMVITLTEIEIYPIKPQEGLIGFVSFVLNEQFYIGNVGLHLRPSGDIRLLYPQKLLGNGKAVNCFHPITKSAGNKIIDQISNEYNALVNKSLNENVEKTKRNHEKSAEIK
jgi:DNA-binding cell septation regulator SpoVG